MRIQIARRFRDDDDDDLDFPTPTASLPSNDFPFKFPQTDGVPSHLLPTKSEDIISPSSTATSTNPIKNLPYTGTYSPSTSSVFSTAVVQSQGPTNIPDLIIPPKEDAAEEHFWAKFSEGVKAAIIISIIFGIVAIIIASIWFCCGKPRRRRLKAEEHIQLQREREDAEARGVNRSVGGSVQDLHSQVPLRDIQGSHRRSIAPAQARGAVGRVASRVSRHISLRGGGGDAPPRYEEVVPPAHQRLAGGMVQRNGNTPQTEEEDGMGVVADGKMPLSEIPFEDVVLTPQRSHASGSASTSESETGRDFNIRHAQGGGDTTGHTNA